MKRGVRGPPPPRKRYRIEKGNQRGGGATRIVHIGRNSNRRTSAGRDEGTCAGPYIQKDKGEHPDGC